MHKNYLVIASKSDKAGMNIVNQLQKLQKYDSNFKIDAVDDEIVYTRNLDLERINQFDFIIFASRHESEKKERTIAIHAPGNWRTAEFGGKSGLVCKTSALFQKQIFKKLYENIQEYNLSGYNLTLECTHHGPLIEKPCIFIEIGSTNKEWEDANAGFVLAKSIFDMTAQFKENPYNEIAVGVGGPHYCPNFNKIQLNSNIAVSHVIPQYSLPLTEEMVKEAINQTEEEVDFVLLDWKGIENAEERNRILEILNKNYIRYRKTDDIKKGY